MGLRPTFKIGDIRKSLEDRMARIDKAIVNRLQYLGEQCVNVARSLDTYKDQTGNLRNSIGYVLLKDGVIIKGDFKRSASVTSTTKAGKTKTTKGSADGVQTGKSFAESLAKGYPRGYVLIVVAGMNYAAAVESKGKDVLTSSELYAKEHLPRMVSQLKANINRMT
ncbi:hypothetical protein [Dyadobacter bucti]|uniref:hypothetical protein n=1 Tax=Dyadobacter bucti TaxID=2572203 RepID=UPI001107BE96|nr:hypothetical protein [Dyadobacter bucti]